MTTNANMRARRADPEVLMISRGELNRLLREQRADIKAFAAAECATFDGRLARLEQAHGLHVSGPYWMEKDRTDE